MPLDFKDPDMKVIIGSSFPKYIEQDIMKFLKERRKTFAWKYEDMKSIYKSIITHKFNNDPSFRLIHPKRKKFSPKRNQIIQEEVENPLKTGMIKKVKFPRWLANMVIVQNKNGKWRVCVDYTDLNKDFPKDTFPLPHIHFMIDAMIGHELLTFMYASAGF